MSTKKRINRHREMAIEAMEQNPICRDSDLELLFQVLYNKGVILSDSQKYAIRNSGVEFKTLLRQRQLLQSQGLFLPINPEVAKKRRRMAAEYAEHYSEVANERL
jgi:hypothetical protein